MAVMTQVPTLADLLKYEEDCLNYSRKNDTVAAGQRLLLGTVVGKKTLDGKCAALDPAATDGTHIAYGVVIADTDATLADITAPLIVRHAILADPAVIWPASLTPAQKATAIEQLDARGILIYPGA